MSLDDVTPDAQRLTAHVHGLVQAVGYRDFCLRTTSALSAGRSGRITGYARNLDAESTVEVVAEGPRDLLEKLLAALRRGPPAAHVLKVEASWSAATREFDRFRMR